MQFFLCRPTQLGQLQRRNRSPGIDRNLSSPVRLLSGVNACRQDLSHASKPSVLQIAWHSHDRARPWGTVFSAWRHRPKMFLPRRPRRFATRSKGSLAKPSGVLAWDESWRSWPVRRGTDFAHFLGDESRKSVMPALFIACFAVSCLEQDRFRQTHRRLTSVMPSQSRNNFGISHGISQRTPWFFRQVPRVPGPLESDRKFLA